MCSAKKVNFYFQRIKDTLISLSKKKPAQMQRTTQSCQPNQTQSPSQSCQPEETQGNSQSCQPEPTQGTSQSCRLEQTERTSRPSRACLPPLNQTSMCNEGINNENFFMF